MTSQLLRKPRITLLSNPRVVQLLPLVLAGCLLGSYGGVLRAGDPVREQSAGAEWQSQLSGALGGMEGWGSFEGAGTFWARQNALQAQTGAMILRKPIRQIVAENTWEQMPDPVIDTFDAKSAAVLGPEATAVAHMQEMRDEQPETSQRLKTDIRTIKPSLSYALREIEASQLPTDYDSRLDKGEYVARKSNPAVLQWAPTNFYHYPLYFEDPALERYGHTYHPLVQPFVSTGRFAGQLVGLPYQMVLNPVHSRQYALGYYRPGEPAPKKTYQIPWNNEAVAIQTAWVAGLFLILP